tara:strand:- start:255 stop:641 length:387 start_codon:yes stop_codon:yes gene_type:complete
MQTITANKVHHTVYKPRYEAYILDAVTDENGDELPTREAKIERLFSRFYEEQGHMVARVGKQKAVAEWLQGLPLNIDYYYDDIVELAIRFGSIDENPSDKLYDKVCENYWSFMANIIVGIKAPKKEGS